MNFENVIYYFSSLKNEEWMKKILFLFREISLSFRFNMKYGIG